MNTKSTIELTHDEVCHALVKYIERDKDERVVGTPMLCVTSGKHGVIEHCVLVLNTINGFDPVIDEKLETNQEKADEIGREVHNLFVEDYVNLQQEIKDHDDKKNVVSTEKVKNYDSRDGRWIVNVADFRPLPGQGISRRL